MANAILLDTNLLLLFVVGATDRALIGKHKRLQAYEQADFEWVQAQVAKASRLLLCPNVVGETSNFIRYTNDAAALRIAEKFKAIIGYYAEDYVSSKLATKHSSYLKLGVTDAVLLTLAQSAGVLVTDDLDLALAAERARVPLINYTYIRAARLDRA